MLFTNNQWGDLLEKFLSPALPSLLLITGMIYCYAIVHFLGLEWHPLVTTGLYILSSIWIGSLYWLQRKTLRRFGIIDYIFCLFVSLIILSIVSFGLQHISVQKFGRYIPFMVIVPFLSGRLMKPKDIVFFIKILTWSGLVMISLLIFSYVINIHEISNFGDRWPFFGQNHSPLLIGMLLASTIIAISYNLVVNLRFDNLKEKTKQTLVLSALGITFTTLVWISARGALAGGILAAMCMIFCARWRSFICRFMLASYILIVILVSFWALPKPQFDLYSKLINNHANIYQSQGKINALDDITKGIDKQSYILGEEACLPFWEAKNSVEIRAVLYQEAIALFLEAPLFGVGASAFGNYSCSGFMGFPHSTILQVFSELGSLGGILFIALIGFTTLIFTREFRISDVSKDRGYIWFIFSMFILYLTTDQLYGNYFMAAGFYFVIGLASGINHNDDSPSSIVCSEEV